MIVHDAAVTFIAVYDAAVQWLIFTAVAISILARAAMACGAWGVSALRRWVDGPVTAPDGSEAPPVLRDAPEAPQAPPRPAWACTDHHDTEEAA